MACPVCTTAAQHRPQHGTARHTAHTTTWLSATVRAAAAATVLPQLQAAAVATTYCRLANLPVVIERQQLVSRLQASTHGLRWAAQVQVQREPLPCQIHSPFAPLLSLRDCCPGCDELGGRQTRCAYVRGVMVACVLVHPIPQVQPEVQPKGGSLHQCPRPVRYSPLRPARTPERVPGGRHRRNPTPSCCSRRQRT